MDVCGRQVRIGPAGWSYPDWNGLVYPATRPRGFHEAAYLAQFFDTVEINTSFYNPLRRETVKTWLNKIEPNQNFRFTAKLWRGFTHDRNATHADEKTFKEGLTPLAEAGRLGALLLQFPWSFKNTPENRDYLAALFMQFVEYPLVLEVRHSSWNSDDALEMLGEMRVGFCNIDQPIVGRSIKPTEHSTSPVGYVRLHGRNYANWFSSKPRSPARYDYLYSLDELTPWIERIRRVAQQSDVTYVVTNNHFEGKAVVNGLQLTSALTSQKVAVPETLLRRYPELDQIAATLHSLQPVQAELFASPGR